MDASAFCRASMLTLVSNRGPEDLDSACGVSAAVLLPFEAGVVEAEGAAAEAEETAMELAAVVGITRAVVASVGRSEGTAVSVPLATGTSAVGMPMGVSEGTATVLATPETGGEIVAEEEPECLGPHLRGPLGAADTTARSGRRVVRVKRRMIVRVVWRMESVEQPIHHAFIYRFVCPASGQTEGGYRTLVLFSCPIAP
jgi:hypothetical protein